MPRVSVDTILVALGAAVKARRVELGYSQERLAEESGLHVRYISDVERGQRNVGFVNVAKLSRALGQDLPSLMSIVEENLHSHRP